MQAEHLGNVLAQVHGSVLEHASFSFVLHNMSRVLTHELVRHRIGAAEEIRPVFGKISELMRKETPIRFRDYDIDDGSWVPHWRKVQPGPAITSPTPAGDHCA